MSPSGRALLRNVYNQMVTELELVWLPRFFKRFRDNASTKHRSKTLEHGTFYTARLSVIRDRTDTISESVDSEGSVQSREIRAKKTLDRRGPDLYTPQYVINTAQCSIWLLAEQSAFDSGQGQTFYVCHFVQT
jgi:hypothetical protein